MNQERGRYNQITALYWRVHRAAMAGVLDKIKTKLTTHVAEMTATTDSGQSVPTQAQADAAIYYVMTDKQAKMQVTTATHEGAASVSSGGPDDESTWWTHGHKIGAFIVGPAVVIGTVIAIVQLIAALLARLRVVNVRWRAVARRDGLMAVATGSVDDPGSTMRRTAHAGTDNFGVLARSQTRVKPSRRGASEGVRWGWPRVRRGTPMPVRWSNGRLPGLLPRGALGRNERVPLRAVIGPGRADVKAVELARCKRRGGLTATHIGIKNCRMHAGSHSLQRQRLAVEPDLELVADPAELGITGTSTPTTPATILRIAL